MTHPTKFCKSTAREKENKKDGLDVEKMKKKWRSVEKNDAAPNGLTEEIDA